MSRISTHLLVRTTVLLSSALLLTMTWGFSGVSKLVAGGVPEWFTSTFGPTILAKFPGLGPSFYSLAAFETLAGVVALGSLLGGEWLRSRPPLLLYVAICASLLLFVQLSFGKQLLSDFDGSHDLFMYFAGSLVMLMAVRAVDTTPPAPRP